MLPWLYASAPDFPRDEWKKDNLCWQTFPVTASTLATCFVSLPSLTQSVHARNNLVKILVKRLMVFSVFGNQDRFQATGRLPYCFQSVLIEVAQVS